MFKKPKKLITVALIAVIAIVVIASCFTIVEAGNTGIVLTFGAVRDEGLSEGLHFKIPFVQRVIQIDNRTQKIETSGTTSSQDLQILTYNVAVNFHVNKASSASLYQNVGLDYSNVIVSPAIQESVKAVTARYTAEQMVTERQAVSEAIKSALSEKVGAYGLTVEVFNFVNFDFSEEFSAAVEAKQTAQQNALKAEQDLARIEVEAKQQITQAQAEAESIKLIQEALSTSPDYVNYVKWNKWDGKLPSVVGGNGTFVTVDELQ